MQKFFMLTYPDDRIFVVFKLQERFGIISPEYKLVWCYSNLLTFRLMYNIILTENIQHNGLFNHLLMESKNSDLYNRIWTYGKEYPQSYPDKDQAQNYTDPLHALKNVE